MMTVNCGTLRSFIHSFIRPDQQNSRLGSPGSGLGLSLCLGLGVGLGLGLGLSLGLGLGLSLGFSLDLGLGLDLGLSLGLDGHNSCICFWFFSQTYVPLRIHPCELTRVY